MKKTFYFTALFLCLAVTAALAETFDVEITDFKFTPMRIVIKKGDTVRWKNKADNQHTVTSGKDGTADGVWTSKRLGRGEVFSRPFESPGEFSYFCEPHSLFRMSGTVEVKE